MSRPIELKTIEQRELWTEYKKKVRTHKSYSIKNFQYFKKNRMDEWNDELEQLTRDMREKMKVLQIQYKEEKEKLQIQYKEQEKEKLQMEGIKNTIRCEKIKETREKIKETRKKNKEMKPVRKSQRIKEQNEVEIISIKTLDQLLKEKMEEAIQKGNYIDLTI
jgi:hypothetical protein